LGKAKGMGRKERMGRNGESGNRRRDKELKVNREKLKGKVVCEFLVAG
jgi:hypothetical protein